MLPPARKGGELQEAALAADGERQAHLIRVESDYRRAGMLSHFLVGRLSHICSPGQRHPLALC